MPELLSRSHDCLQRPPMRLGCHLNVWCVASGAATTDIIVQYVSTIKTLREVDTSGVLLEAVADPIREYLRSRKVGACMPRLDIWSPCGWSTVNASAATDYLSWCIFWCKLEVDATDWLCLASHAGHHPQHRHDDDG